MSPADPFGRSNLYPDVPELNSGTSGGHQAAGGGFAQLWGWDCSLKAAVQFSCPHVRALFNIFPD
jgi:hypothetical protein